MYFYYIIWSPWVYGFNGIYIRTLCHLNVLSVAYIFVIHIMLLPLIRPYHGNLGIFSDYNICNFIKVLHVIVKNRYKTIKNILGYSCPECGYTRESRMVCCISIAIYSD